MPVYKEDLDFVIKPSIQSLKVAADKYKDQGGLCNIFVNDDGLQCISNEEKEKREKYYKSMGIGYVARPPNGYDGYIRRGRFKKASNMNFCMDISEQVRLRALYLHIDKNFTYNNIFCLRHMSF